jgi:hypothetical protein
MLDTVVTAEASDDPNFVRVSRDCPDCKVTQHFTVPKSGFDAWDYGRGSLVQFAFPDLDAPLREMLVSGVCPSCWDKIFGKEE